MCTEYGERTGVMRRLINLEGGGRENEIKKWEGLNITHTIQMPSCRKFLGGGRGGTCQVLCELYKQKETPYTRIKK